MQAFHAVDSETKIYVIDLRIIKVIEIDNLQRSLKLSSDLVIHFSSEELFITETKKLLKAISDITI